MIDRFWTELQAILIEGGWVFVALIGLAFLIAYSILAIWNAMGWSEAVVLSGKQWKRLLRGQIDNPRLREKLRSYVAGAGDSGFEEIEQSLFAKPRRRIPFAFVLVGAAPLVGLLGTVSGMMSTFHGLASASQSTPIETISRGISEALITTQTGLIIGIPGFIICTVLKARLDRRVFAFERLVASLRQTMIEETDRNREEEVNSVMEKETIPC